MGRRHPEGLVVYQSILFYALGFLSAGFLALIAAPAIWRRAVALTRKRVEAATPMSMGEIQADKDRLRAEFAMTIRRLEMSVQSSREKTSLQSAEISRNIEEMKRLNGDIDQANAAIEALEEQASGLRVDIARRTEDGERLAARLGDTENRLAERERDLADLGRLFRDTSISASNLQIDLVARETEVEKLLGEVSLLRNERREQNARLRELANETRAAKEALNVEKARSADFEKRLERTMSALAEREEKLDRREKDYQRVREELKMVGGSEDRLAGQLAEEKAARVKLEADLERMTQQARDLANGDTASVIARLTAERGRLEDRLTRMARENKRLREAAARGEAVPADSVPSGEESGVLREQIHELAAEVVALTMKLEGETSPIHAALAKPQAQERTTGDLAGPLSIADRVRELQKKPTAVQ